MNVDHKTLAEFGELYELVQEQYRYGDIDDRQVIRVLKLAVQEWFVRLRAAEDESKRLKALLPKEGESA